MAVKFSKSVAVLAIGVAFLLTPALLLSTSLISVDSAFAAKGGNGNGKSGGNGNGNSGGNGNGNGSGNASGNGNSSAKSEKSRPAKTEKAAKSVEVASTEKKAKTKIASKLGALNAAHASANALANANPNSRVGKIAAYRDANAAAVESAAALKTVQDQLKSLNEAVTNYNTALADVTIAEGTLATDAPALQAIINDPLATEEAKATATADLQDLNDAVTDAQAIANGLQAAAVAAAPQIPGAEAAVTQATNVAAADEAAALAALEMAANKPVDAEVRAAVNALLLGK